MGVSSSIAWLGRFVHEASVGAEGRELTDASINPIRRGVVAVTPRDDRLLVIRRSRHVVAPLAICFPGGGIEPGESEPVALAREMAEELGVAAEPIRRLWHSVTPWRTDLAWWLTRLAAEAELTPNPAEVDSVYWLTPRELLEMPDLLLSNRDFLTRLSSGEIDVSLER